MTSSQGFKLHPDAARDISEIRDSIAVDNPIAAQKVVEEILHAVRLLAKFPNLGHKRPDLTSSPLRFYTVRKYVIAYAPDENPLLVVAVLHGSRSPRVLAAILRGREE